jgi:hypothetical protein
MDKINDFINHRLPENFMYDDDYTIEKLQRCIDKLQRYRFDSGPLLESIPPTNELPTMPFGDLNKSSQQELIARIQHYHKHKSEATQSRDAQLELIANDRLQVEKRLRADRKQARQEERKRLAELNGGGDASQLEKYLNSSGKPIKNISDSDDDDDDGDEYPNGHLDTSDDDDDHLRRRDENGYNSDDLNPSKISEYDKESMLSSMTRQSTPQHKSYNDIERARHSKSPTNQSKTRYAFFFVEFLPLYYKMVHFVA